MRGPLPTFGGPARNRRYAMACGHPGPPDSLDKPGRVSKQAGVREPGGSGGGLLLIKRGPGAGRVVEAAMSQAVAQLTEQLSGQPAQRSFAAPLLSERARSGMCGAGSRLASSRRNPRASSNAFSASS